MNRIIKTIFLCLLFHSSVTVYSQDTVEIKRVDSLVTAINNSNYKIQRDTLKQDHPEIGLFIKTYLAMVTNGTELKKYENNVHTTTQENGATKRMVATNTFYFDHNKLIKVEEFATEGDKKFDAAWYYAEDKPIYYTFQSDKSEERAERLLTMAKSMLEKMGFK